ncbi:MAG: group III truncated hemoglobin [Proteobacteria bacterium]|nr:group III truncated hemoglobin [Pseudomonadota bacterium]
MEPVVEGSLLPSDLDEGMVRAVVHGFYARIRDDDLLGPLFNRVIADEKWPHHLGKMSDFWSSVVLRTGRYQGRPLPPHLVIPELEEDHFRRWLGLFEATVSQICPPETASLFMDRALRIAHSFRLSIAFNRGEDTLGIKPITRQSLPGFQ